MTRSLYDYDYLDSGCTLEYDSSFNADDIPSTYITNYVIFGTGLVLAAALLFKHGIPSSPNFGLMAFYFLLQGISFGLSGVSHQVIERQDSLEHHIFTSVVGAFLIASGALLLALALSHIHPGNKVLQLVGGLFSAIVLAACVFLENWWSIQAYGALISYSYVGLVSVLMLVIYLMQSVSRKVDQHTRRWNGLKAGALLIMGVAMIVQLTLAGTCGAGGYEDCFEKCPLPNPTVFNHNALFHVLYNIGILLYGIAEYIQPTLFHGFHRNESYAGASQHMGVEQKGTNSDTDKDVNTVEFEA